jgi:hypothetical protein
MEPSLDLWTCAPLKARLTVSTCAANQARAKATKRGTVNMVSACLTCPGVLSLNATPVARVERDTEQAQESSESRRMRRQKHIGPSLAFSPQVRRAMARKAAKDSIC